jgi:integrase
MNGTIQKRERKDGKPSWGYVFDLGKDAEGKRRQSTKCGFGTKREAEEALRKAIATAEAETAEVVPSLPSFSAFFERWMAEHVIRKCAPKTAERYRELGQYAIRHMVIVPRGEPMRFGDILLDAIGPMHLDLMTNALLDAGGAATKKFPSGRPLSPETVRHIMVAVHGVFEKAVKWRLINPNPMDDVDLPKVERTAPGVLDRRAISTLFDSARGTRLYPFLVLAASTGGRRGEFLALQWADIDFLSGIVSVSKSLEQTRAGLRIKSTKSGKPRKFAVPAIALKVLREFRVEQDGDRKLFGVDYREQDLIFCRPDGDYYSPHAIGMRVASLMNKASLKDVSLHSL